MEEGNLGRCHSQFTGFNQTVSRGEYLWILIRHLSKVGIGKGKAIFQDDNAHLRRTKVGKDHE